MAATGLIRICSYCRRMVAQAEGWRVANDEEISQLEESSLVSHGICPPCALVANAEAKEIAQGQQATHLPLCLGCRQHKPARDSEIRGPGPLTYSVCEDCFEKGARTGPMTQKRLDGQTVMEPRLVRQDGKPWKEWIRCLSCQQKFFRFNMVDTVCSRACVEG